MSTPSLFSRADAERRLGLAVVAKGHRVVDDAPSLSAELHAQLRAVFASARTPVARPGHKQHA